ATTKHCRGPQVISSPCKDVLCTPGNYSRDSKTRASPAQKSAAADTEFSLVKDETSMNRNTQLIHDLMTGHATSNGFVRRHALRGFELAGVATLAVVQILAGTSADLRRTDATAAAPNATALTATAAARVAGPGTGSPAAHSRPVLLINGTR